MVGNGFVVLALVAISIPVLVQGFLTPYGGRHGITTKLNQQSRFLYSSPKGIVSPQFETREGLGSDAFGLSASTNDGLSWAKEMFPEHDAVASKATRISGVLADIWEVLADPVSGEEGGATVLLFPDCAAIENSRGLQNLYAHLEVCQDACERFGTEVSIIPHPTGGRTNAPVPALVVQPVKGSGGGDSYDCDDDWDGDWDIDRSLLGDDDESEMEGAEFGTGVGGELGGMKALTAVPESDQEIIGVTKEWVQAVITDMGVCPFSVDAARAGLPVGKVYYPVTRETSSEAIYREYWREVERVVSEEDERALSTTLLITPSFALSNIEAFEVMGQTLTQPLESLHVEDDIQLVFFHPLYTFRDGQDRLGDSGAANFARRSPFPMINILRTKQVRLAQKSIPTGLVYKQNEAVLTKVGSSKLQNMLEARDWAGLSGLKVDRRNVEYYNIARTLQGIGAGQQVEVEGGHHSKSGGPQSGNSGGETMVEMSTTAAYAETNMAPGEFRENVGEVQPLGSQGEDESMEDLGANNAGEAGLGQASETAERVSNEDVKQVASVLFHRLGSGNPLSAEKYEKLSSAIDNILRDTEALSG